jgi:hypothetical protein
MIQDPNIIPKSLEVAGWIGGASFTLWAVKVAFELFKKSQKENNGKAGAEVTRKAVEWALHLNEQGELHECTKEIVKTQTSQAQLLERLTTSYERQTELLESINLANKRG